MISEEDRAEPTKPTGGPEGDSCGRLMTLLDSEGDPSPTLFTALTRNLYEVAAFKLLRRIQRFEAETLLSSVTQFRKGSGIGPEMSAVEEI